MKTFKYLLGTLALAGAMVACTPEEFPGMDEAGLVQTSQYKDLFTVSVDQSINQVTVNFKGAPEVYPVWELNLAEGKKEYSTAAQLSRIILLEGDYSVKCYIGNRNGISKDAIEIPFHINESIIDYTEFYTKISKGTWYMDAKAVGHIACGPSAQDPTGWWKAGENEKAEFGLYDNELTFTADGQYTFNPGAHGTLYANKCVSKLNLNNETSDFCYAVDLTTTTFEFKQEGEDLYLLFPSQTPFPYISSDQIWETPRYKVLNLTSKAMTLVSFQTTQDNPDGIGWQYILTTQREVKEEFNGFDVNSPDNLWKLANPKFQSLYYAHGGSWEGLPDYEHSEANGVFTVKLPTATDAQWQAQYCLGTDLNSSNVPANAVYDFSCVITPNKDLTGITLKLTSSDDQTSIIEQRVDVAGGEPNVVYFTELPGQTIDGNYKFVFDFGGNPDDTEIVMKDFVLIDHSKNNVKVPGGNDGNGNGGNVNWDAAANLLNGQSFDVTTFYAHGDGWEGYPEYTHSYADGVHSISLPSASDLRWQAQYTLNNWGVALSADKAYDFRVKVSSNKDLNGMTVKLTQQDNDEVFLTEGQHDVPGFEETWIELPNLKMNKPQDITNLKIVFDFGGNAEGTEITLSDMLLQEHQEGGNGGSSAAAPDYNSDNNMWKAVDSGDRFLSVTPWFSPADWSGGINPTWSHQGNVWSVTIPEGMGGSQWQGQFPINTTLTAELAATYTFSCTIESDKDLPGVTIKLTETDEGDTKHDDNFYFDDRHDVEAFEPFVYVMTGAKLKKNDAHALSLFFDFGGSPIGANVQISNIVLMKE